MNESQDEDRGQRVREEQDPQGHIVAKGRQDPFGRPDEGRTTSRATALIRRSPSSTENVNSPRGRPRGSSPERASRAAQITRNVTRPPMMRRFVKPIW